MKLARCVRCNRDVDTKDNRYRRHSTGTHGDTCELSYLRVPVSGCSPTDFEERAKLVTELAADVQDADPSRVWEYLTALSGVELQRLLMVSFAAIPTDKTLSELFGWVTDLPAAKVSA